MIPKRAFRAGNEVVMSKEKVDRSKSEIGDSKGNLAYKERKRWTLFGLPFTFTEFYIYDNDIQIRAGLLDSNEDDCYMYRITDVKLKQSLFQKMFGLGTVECYTSDVTVQSAVRIIEHLIRAGIQNDELASQTFLGHTRGFDRTCEP